ncbi:MAG: DUF2846 domain-containing protein [Limisphaerales bacterium]
MKRLIRRPLSLLAFSSFLLAGCAGGPRLNESQTSLPPVPEGNGRIYFYRTSTAGAAVQPSIKLNGEKVGVAKPRGVFYVDRPPGNYEVETKTEVTRKLSLQLAEQQTRYVRFKVGMGFFIGHISPELVEPAIGESEIGRCRLISASDPLNVAEQ